MTLFAAKYAHVCVYIYIYIHTHTHTHIHTYTRIHTYKKSGHSQTTIAKRSLGIKPVYWPQGFVAAEVYTWISMYYRICRGKSIFVA
jgi:hypothetical protein